MNGINDKKTVEKQYASSKNLKTRISIHEKYSTNKQGFGNWIFSHYEIADGARVLELGCGTGDMWKGHEDLITKCSQLVLTDFSDAMVETAKKNVGEKLNVVYQSADIQNIPFPADSFDAVIANMMLYHVPDFDKGLSEVRRVLKEDGKFYCATFGEHGIMEYLSSLLSEYGVQDNVNKNFTLQNGDEKLVSVFSEVIKKEYKDSLAVTDLDDMVDYIYSLSSMTSLCNVPKEKIKAILKNHTVNGVLSVPKEYGMFIASGEKI